MLNYLHPIIGALAIGLLFHASSVGMRSRRRGKAAVRARIKHRWVGPLAFKLYLLGWLSGASTVYLLRDDLHATQSAHFKMGTAAILLLTLTAIISSKLPKRWAQQLHPLLGGAAVFLGIAQVIFGIDLLY